MIHRAPRHRRTRQRCSYVSVCDVAMCQCAWRERKIGKRTETCVRKHLTHRPIHNTPQRPMHTTPQRRMHTTPQRRVSASTPCAHTATRHARIRSPSHSYGRYLRLVQLVDNRYLTLFESCVYNTHTYPHPQNILCRQKMLCSGFKHKV